MLKHLPSQTGFCRCYCHLCVCCAGQSLSSGTFAAATCDHPGPRAAATHRAIESSPHDIKVIDCDRELSAGEDSSELDGELPRCPHRARGRLVEFYGFEKLIKNCMMAGACGVYRCVAHGKVFFLTSFFLTKIFFPLSRLHCMLLYGGWCCCIVDLQLPTTTLDGADI